MPHMDCCVASGSVSLHNIKEHPTGVSHRCSVLVNGDIPKNSHLLTLKLIVSLYPDANY